MEEGDFVTKLKLVVYAAVAKLKTTQIIIIGFLITITIGSILLALPIAGATGNSIGFLNALYTATSATCVTGLTVVETYSQWSLFGQVVLLVLVQIGGIGFTTLVMIVFIALGKKITLKERLVIREWFNQSELTGMVRLVRTVILLTFLIEAVATVVLAVRFACMPGIGLGEAVWLGLFHAVSSFCHAGFDLFGNDSLMRFVGDPVINLVVTGLVVITSLGFTVLLDFARVYKSQHKEQTFSLVREYHKLTLHSKIALEMTAILLILGFVVYLLLEFENPSTMGWLTVPQRVLASWFQSVTPRTSGFYTVPPQNLREGSKLFTIILMYIGGSPVGMAGGLKTVSFGIIVLAVISVVRGKTTIVIHNRTIPFFILQKALAVMMLNTTIIIASTILLTVTDGKLLLHFNLIDILFEVTSAVGTVGLSMGISTHLSVVGKLIMMFCMFYGRLGPIALALALSNRSGQGNGVHYPEEKVMVG